MSLGILCEEVDTENGLLPDYRVRFSNHYVYTFLITDFWLKEHNLNPLLFEKIIAFYQKNHLLKYEILRWIVKLIFRQSRGLEMNQLCTMMENMFENIEEINLPSEYIYLLIKLIGIGIKKNVYE